MSSIDPGAPYAGTPAPAPAGKRPWYKKKRSWLLIIIGLFILLFAGCAALVAGVSSSDTVQDAATSATQSADPTEPVPDAASEPAPSTEVTEAPSTTTEAPAPEPTATEADLTAGQENAIGSAKDYLEYQSFSRSGLIKQLEFEQYSTEDATFAVDSLGIDYNEQAALKAAEYLETSSFSRGSLIQQLEFEGFSAEEAAFGADQAGL